MRIKEDEQFRTLSDKFNVAAELYRKQVEKLQRENPNIRISTDSLILDTLRSSNSKVVTINGMVEVEK